MLFIGLLLVGGLKAAATATEEEMIEFDVEIIEFKIRVDFPDAYPFTSFHNIDIYIAFLNLFYSLCLFYKDKKLVHTF